MTLMTALVYSFKMMLMLIMTVLAVCLVRSLNRLLYSNCLPSYQPVYLWSSQGNAESSQFIVFSLDSSAFGYRSRIPHIPNIDIDP
ncbi:hypothetical protein F4860DRAFT_490057 [Xylaria cubensis]|nr:hypothetical protein F4860DRAFT_490057 [Xylaria cubensis]